MPSRYEWILPMHSPTEFFESTKTVLWSTKYPPPTHQSSLLNSTWFHYNQVAPNVRRVAIATCLKVPWCHLYATQTTQWGSSRRWYTCCSEKWRFWFLGRRHTHDSSSDATAQPICVMQSHFQITSHCLKPCPSRYYNGRYYHLMEPTQAGTSRKGL